MQHLCGWLFTYAQEERQLDSLEQLGLGIEEVCMGAA
jgi:hypothetical protein